MSDVGVVLAFYGESGAAERALRDLRTQGFGGALVRKTSDGRVVVGAGRLGAWQGTALGTAAGVLAAATLPLPRWGRAGRRGCCCGGCVTMSGPSTTWRAASRKRPACNCPYRFPPSGCWTMPTLFRAR